MTRPVAVLDRAEVRFRTGCALPPVDLELGAGERLAVVGPSGSGKSTLLHVLGLLTRPTSGRASVLGADASALAPAAADRLRRGRIGISLQDDPLLDAATAEENVALAHRLSGGARRDAEALARARAELAAVGLGPRAATRAGRLSGGERSRVALLRALASGRELVLLDEPTAAVDPETGRRALDAVLASDAAPGRRTVVCATHDADVADRMERRIELCPPDSGRADVEPAEAPPAAPGDLLLAARGVARAFRSGREWVPVLRDASLDLRAGECVALCGPSGSGKTTLLAVLAGLERPDAGVVYRSGARGATAAALDAWRARSVGFVSQMDPLPAFLPPGELLRVAAALARGAGGRAASDPEELLRELVPAAIGRRDPRTLSGGERRRVALARALVHGPRILLLDEACAGLGRTVARNLVRLLRGYARGTGAAVLFTTHDPVLLGSADRVVRLAGGSVVEGTVVEGTVVEGTVVEGSGVRA